MDDESAKAQVKADSMTTESPGPEGDCTPEEAVAAVKAVRAETPFPVGVRVCSAHNPGSRGTVVSVHRVDGSVGVLWDGYEKSERWSPEALRYVGW